MFSSFLPLLYNPIFCPSPIRPTLPTKSTLGSFSSFCWFFWGEGEERFEVCNGSRSTWSCRKSHFSTLLLVGNGRWCILANSRVNFHAQKRQTRENLWKSVNLNSPLGICWIFLRVLLQLEVKFCVVPPVMLFRVMGKGKGEGRRENKEELPNYFNSPSSSYKIFT